MNDTIKKDDVTGLILAGGRGTRMGQVDKGLQSFRGMPMVMHVLERMAPQTASVIINANQNLGVYQRFGCAVYPDLLDGFAGPLAGLQTGMKYCKTPYLISAPCDSPFLAHDLVEKLAAGLVYNNADLALAVTFEPENGTLRRQSHPVFALLKADLLPSLEEFLNQGGRKVDAWFATLKSAQVVFDDHTAFRNINTVQELKQYET